MTIWVGASAFARLPLSLTRVPQRIIIPYIAFAVFVAIAASVRRIDTHQLESPSLTPHPPTASRQTPRAREQSTNLLLLLLGLEASVRMCDLPCINTP